MFEWCHIHRKQFLCMEKRCYFADRTVITWVALKCVVLTILIEIFKELGALSLPMCKIGLGVTFRVGNRRKPLKNFEQVKCFLFVCLFRLCAFCASKGEQHNTYNENYCFRFLHDGYDYNHSVDNSASLQNPRHQVQHLSTTYRIWHFQHCSVFVFVRNCFTILVVQESLQTAKPWMLWLIYYLL